MLRLRAPANGIWESRKSGDRSQNGSGVRAEESADLFQHGGERFDITVAEVLGEDQKVAAFLDGGANWTACINASATFWMHSCTLLASRLPRN